MGSDQAVGARGRWREELRVAVRALGLAAAQALLALLAFSWAAGAVASRLLAEPPSAAQHPLRAALAGQLALGLLLALASGLAGLAVGLVAAAPRWAGAVGGALAGGLVHLLGEGAEAPGTRPWPLAVARAAVAAGAVLAGMAGVGLAGRWVRGRG